MKMEKMVTTEELEKAEDLLFEKGRVGVYANTPENVKLDRVGQHYGQAAKTEERKNPKNAKTEELKTKDKKAPMDNSRIKENAKNADTETLENVILSTKAPFELKVAAKNELKRRNVETEAIKKASDDIVKSRGKSLEDKDFKEFKIKIVSKKGGSSEIKAGSSFKVVKKDNSKLTIEIL